MTQPTQVFIRSTLESVHFFKFWHASHLFCSLLHHYVTHRGHYRNSSKLLNSWQPLVKSFFLYRILFHRKTADILLNASKYTNTAIPQNIMVAETWHESYAVNPASIEHTFLYFKVFTVLIRRTELTVNLKIIFISIKACGDITLLKCTLLT